LKSAPNDSCMGVGVDLVALGRFAEFVQRNEPYLREVFTRQELAAAEAARRDLYLASRWALKEAVLKALGTGWGSGVQWTDVEAVGDLSAPRITLHGRAKRIADGDGRASVVGTIGWAGECVIAISLIDAGSNGQQAGRRDEIPSR